MKKVFIIAAFASLALTGCLENAKEPAPVKETTIQKEMCMFNEIDKAATRCKEGQLAVFLPAFFGNEQLPIFAASQFCDYRYQIVYNNGGVSCVYTGQRLEKKPEPQTSAPAAK